MIDTLTSKCKSENLATKLLNSKTSLKKSLETRCQAKNKSQYFKSNENLLRSLNVYYAHSVMGKRKYVSIRKANEVKGQPNFVNYKTLAAHISKIDIGNVYSIHPEFTKNVPPDEKCEGLYRNVVEYCPRLAQFYLKVDKERVDKLRRFPGYSKKDSESVIFLIAFGGDEAPKSGTSFLIFFLNVGRRIVSSTENFLIFGSNVKESGLVVKKYLRRLMSDFKVLEEKVFHVEVNSKLVKVEFKIESVPNDMKMLCFLGGELTNAAYYFTTFADVNQGDAVDISKCFNSNGNSKTEWQPFSYKKRLDDSKLVAVKKKELSKKNLKPATIRNNLTCYIKSLESRQEEVPLIGTYIDKAKCEPLHMKNNVVKELFMKIVYIVLEIANIPASIKKLSELPEQSIFVFFINFVSKSMNSNYLGKKLRLWFDESANFKSEKRFSFRF